MITFESKDISRRSGDLLEAADQAPVQITRYKRPKYVLMRKDTYDELVARSPQTAYFTKDMPADHLDLLDHAIENLNAGSD
jgi:hypothetical protein